jgi:hypothetical protein
VVCSQIIGCDLTTPSRNASQESLVAPACLPGRRSPAPAGYPNDRRGPPHGSEPCVEAVDALIEGLGLPRTLAGLGLPQSRLGWLAEQGMTAVRLVQNNHGRWICRR